MGKEPFSEVISLALRVGDQLQGSMMELMASFLTLEEFIPRGVMQTTFDMLQQSTEVVEWLTPGRDNRLSLREFQNKLQAFSLFEYADVMLNLPAETHSPLQELVDKVYALGPYVAVWVMEGLGCHYAEQCWERQQVPRNLLTDERVKALPEQSLVPLHTGMGLSFADRLLRRVQPQSPIADIRRVLQQFVTLCKENARSGYTGAVMEALGLVVRHRCPEMVPIVAQQWSDIAPDESSSFWHGVGRGLYFLPANSVPCALSGWRLEEMLHSEAPHVLGRLNVLAGLTWALILVNIRHPEIVETFVKQHGDVLSANDAFANGVSSSIMIWHDITRDDPYLKAFCRHQPDPSEPGLVQLWNSQVRAPCQDALQQYYGGLKDQHGLGEVFRYQSLPALVDRLRRASQS
jgi:hypothetical protein